MNVHPAKLEVKFKSESMVYDLISSAISSSLHSLRLEAKTPPRREDTLDKSGKELLITEKDGETGLSESENEKKVQDACQSTNNEALAGKNLPSYSLQMKTQKENEKEFRDKEKVDDRKIKSPSHKGTREKGFSATAQGFVKRTQLSLEENFLNHSRVFSQFKPLGQLHDLYLLLEAPDGLVIVDQHALHEKVLYEEYRANLIEKRVESQVLLSPVEIHLSPADAALVERSLEFLKQLGFEIEPFGPSIFLVRSIPVILKRTMDPSFIYDIISDLRTMESYQEKRMHPEAEAELREEIIKKLACSTAIKSGRKLDISQMMELLRLALKAKEPLHCPHGRPTMVFYTLDQLKKEFKRD